MAMPFTTPFYLRAKNAAGGVTYTFRAGTGVGTLIEMENPEPLYIEREKLDGSPAPYMLGYIRRYTVAFEVSGYAYIPAYSGYSTLEAVLNSAGNAGYSLEASSDGSNYYPVSLDGAPSKTKLEGKNVGVRVELSLRGMENPASHATALAAAPYRVS